MSASPEPLDLEQVKQHIRDQAARRRAEVAASIRLPFANPALGWTFNWTEAKSFLRTASQLPPLDAMPTLERYHGVRRRVARLLARVVLTAIRYILERQISWNRCILDVLPEMGKSLHDVETRVVQQQERIRLLEETVARLQLQIASTPPGPSPQPAPHWKSA